MDGGTVDVPVIGRAPKRVVIGAAVALVAYVGYAYWRASKNAAAAAETPVDPSFADPGVLPVVPGGASSSGGGGGVTGGTGGVTGDPNAILTNQQWTDQVRQLLSGVYDDLAIVEALGLYLQNKPLTAANTRIIQSALAVAGLPPVGTHPIITSGGDTGLIVAPSGLQITRQRQDGFLITWGPVAGASSYRIYEGGEHTADNTAPECGVQNRAPGGTYGPFEVAAVTSSGLEGPKSQPIMGATLGASVATPAPTPAPTPSAPAGPKYPTRRTFHTNVKGDNYSTIATAEGTGLSGQALYEYQFLPEAGRSADAISKIRSRGANLIEVGGSTAIPYHH